jgi:hypothetical protein
MLGIQTLVSLSRETPCIYVITILALLNAHIEIIVTLFPNQIITHT